MVALSHENIAGEDKNRRSYDVAKYRKINTVLKVGEIKHCLIALRMIKTDWYGSRVVFDLELVGVSLSGHNPVRNSPS